MKTAPAPAVPPAENEQDKLTKLRAELSEATAQRDAAQQQYFNALQAASAEPHPCYRGAVDRLSARVSELESAVSVAEREHERAVAQNRLAASRLAQPEYRQLVGKLATSLKDMQTALTMIRKFRSKMEHEGTWSPELLEGVDWIVGELADNERLTAAITQLETIAGQNGRFE
jgi:hypothetical protein